MASPKVNQYPEDYSQQSDGAERGHHATGERCSPVPLDGDTRGSMDVAFVKSAETVEQSSMRNGRCMFDDSI